MKNNESFQNVGMIDTSGFIEYKLNPDKSNVCHNININKTPINSVNIFNKNVLNIIADDGTYVNTHIQVPIDLPQVEDISGRIFYIMRYRRCTVYLIHQESSRGERFLAYLSDKIVHSGECFGTNINHVKKSDIINVISEHYVFSEEKFGI